MLIRGFRLKLSLRNPTLLDQVWWHLLMRVNKPEVDLLREFQTRYPTLQETVKYINLSSAYIFRIHMLLVLQRDLNFC
jgi:hypothetical protein